MKPSRKFLFTNAATGLSLLAAFFIWELSRRSDLESQANALMTDSITHFLSDGDSGSIYAHADPQASINLLDTKILGRYGRLVVIDPPQGGAQIPNSLSGITPTAQFVATAHFGLGKVSSEAIMTYRDGKWIFTHFSVTPGPLAE